MVANIFNIPLTNVLFDFFFLFIYVISAHSSYIGKQLCGRSLKNCLGNCKAFAPAELFIITY